MKRTFLLASAVCLCFSVFTVSGGDFKTVKLRNSDFAKLTKKGYIASWGTYKKSRRGAVRAVQDPQGSGRILQVTPAGEVAELVHRTPLAVKNKDAVRICFFFRLKCMDNNALKSRAVLNGPKGSKKVLEMPTFRSVMRMPVPNAWTKYEHTLVIGQQEKEANYTFRVLVRGKVVEFRDFSVKIKKAK